MPDTLHQPLLPEPRDTSRAGRIVAIIGGGPAGLMAAETPIQLANAIKSLPLALGAPRLLDEAISSAGGVRFESLGETRMLRDLPGVFAPVKCSTGKRLPAAICSRPVLPADAWRGRAR